MTPVDCWAWVNCFCRTCWAAGCTKDDDEDVGLGSSPDEDASAANLPATFVTSKPIRAMLVNYKSDVTNCVFDRAEYKWVTSFLFAAFWTARSTTGSVIFIPIRRMRFRTRF